MCIPLLIFPVKEPRRGVASDRPRTASGLTQLGRNAQPRLNYYAVPTSCHAAQALWHIACRKGYEVTYERTSVLFDWIHAGRGDGTYQRRLRQVGTVALLVLDDFGLKPLPERGGREAATGGGHRASGVILGAERTRTLSNRRGAAASENPTTTPQPWIEQVPHRVTEHVSQPWRRLHILTPFSAEHTSPARKVDWQTESEEA